MPSSSKKRKRKNRPAYYDDPKYKAGQRKLALANPYFNGELNHTLSTKDKWTEEHRQNSIKHITKYNQSKAGKKMASKRQKAYFKQGDARLRMAELRRNEDPNCLRRQGARERGYGYFQKWNQERHEQAERRKSIRWWREMYKNGGKPPIKPLPNQPQEYYDDLDEFFAEGL